MSSFNEPFFLELEGGGFLELEGGGLLLLESKPDKGTPIINLGAGSPGANGYEICERSGRRVLPGKLVREWTGLMVHHDYADEYDPQFYVRVKAENITGSINPEPQNRFVEDEYPNGVTANDL